jgi:hypothetical protein
MAYTPVPSVVTGQTYSASNYNTYVKGNFDALSAQIAALPPISGIFPIGCIYVTTVATNPASVLGFGTWTAFGAGRTLVGVGTSDAAYAAGATGGESKHVLLATEMPSHTHVQTGHMHTYISNTLHTDGAIDVPMSGYNNVYGNSTISSGSTTAVNQNTGGGLSHNNLPPYIVVYFWKRIA